MRALAFLKGSRGFEDVKAGVTLSARCLEPSLDLSVEMTDEISLQSLPPTHSVSPSSASHLSLDTLDIAILLNSTVQATSNMRQDNHLNGRLLRHKWTSEDRSLLALLLCFYSNPLHQLCRIWSLINQKILLTEGFPHSRYPLKALRSQIAEMKRGGVGSHAWNIVMGVSISQSRKAFLSKRQTIENAARSLRIQLAYRAEVRANMPPVTQLTPPTASRSSVQPISTTTARVDEWVESSSDEEEHDTDSPCVRRQQRLSATLIRSFTFDAMDPSVTQAELTNAPVSAPSSTTDASQRLPPRLRLHLSGAPNSPSRAPSLLFRGFLSGGGFKARKFLNIPDARVPPPPPFQSETFRERVEPHLREYRRENASYLSPFLSLAENPLNALKRITQSGLPLSFAIFYFQDVMDDGIARYGNLCQPYPYLCPTIVGEHDLDDLPGGYTGAGEWLCWGSIECPPVAVFNRDEAILLMRTLAAIKKIDASSGRALGQRLTPVSDKYKELVAYKFLRSIKVRGYLQSPKSKAYHEFIDAVYDVSRGNRAESVFSEYDIDTPSSSPNKSHAQVIVEVPVSAKEVSQQDEATTERHRQAAQRPRIDWHSVEETPRGRRVAVAIPGSNGRTLIDANSMIREEGGHVQHPLSARFKPETPQAPARHSLSPTAAFFQQLQDAAIPTPPPVPPVIYTSRVSAASSFGSNSSSAVVIVDLCDSEDDIEMSEPDSSSPKTQTQTRTQPQTVIDDENILELPNVDLTGQKNVNAPYDNANNIADNVEDFEVIGTATRTHPVPRMSMSTTLSIRSRSLSHTVSPRIMHNSARAGNTERRRGHEFVRARGPGWV